MTHLDAMIALLAMPDEPCMRRAYHVTAPMHHWIDVEYLKRDLGTAYVAWRRQEHAGGDISCVVSVRCWPRLRQVV